MPRSPEDLPFGAALIYRGEIPRTFPHISNATTDVVEHVVEVDSKAVDLNLRASYKRVRELLHQTRLDRSAGPGRRLNLAKSALELRKQVRGRGQ